MTTDRRIIMAVHGPWGTGKSWFADTVPGPRLIIDAEGGTMDTPSDKVHWTDLRQLPPEGDSVVVDVTSWSQVETVLQFLENVDHPFESVIIDSFTEIQKQLKDKLSDGAEEVFDQQAWGKLLNHMEGSVRRLRNLSRPSTPEARRVNVMIVSGTDQERLPKAPMFQGGLRKSFEGYFDIVGYLTTERNADGEYDRVMQIQPVEGVVSAKCRLHNVAVQYPKGRIINPDFTESILTHV